MSFGTYQPRYYKTKAGSVPSATTVLSLLDKPALIQWAANMACDYVREQVAGKGFLGEDEVVGWLEDAKYNYKKASKKALGIGTTVHDAAEAYLKKGTEPDFDLATQPEICSSWEAFKKWIDKNNVVPIEIECEIHGEGYAGRADLVCKLNNVLTLVDFKTSKGHYPEYALQTAAYREGYNRWVEDPDKKIQANGSLRLDKMSGRPSYKDYSDQFENDFKSFMCLVNFWHLNRKEK